MEFITILTHNSSENFFNKKHTVFLKNTFCRGLRELHHIIRRHLRKSQYSNFSHDISEKSPSQIWDR